jgi:lambda repressor-like predicted transcriptional regulator
MKHAEIEVNWLRNGMKDYWLKMARIAATILWVPTEYLWVPTEYVAPSLISRPPQLRAS